MNKSTNTINNPIEGAELKTRSTTIKNMGDLHNLFSEAGASENEIKTLHSILTGQSTIAAACQKNNIVDGDEPIANTINRIRNRFSTVLMDSMRVITKPVIQHYNAEFNAAAKVEAQQNLIDKIAEWEKNGKHGRKPGESNRPKSAIAIEKTHAEARRNAREQLGIATQGRINPELQENFVNKFRTIYTKALTNLAKKFEELGDETKIEKLVNRGVKELAVSPSAQKSGSIKNPKETKDTKNTKKNEIADIPVSENTEIPEPVAME